MNKEYEVGEMHISADGQELYFHSDRQGGLGELDIWVSQLQNGAWGAPQNVNAVNSVLNDSRPFLTADGTELWFTRDYQGSPVIFRSQKKNGEWQEPELIISHFAGEPTLDPQRNIYFVHHFIIDGIIVDADIYVAYKQ